MMTWLLWFIVAVIFAIIELVVPSFFMIWFGVGALAAMVVALLTNMFIIQVLVFIIVSVILLFLTRKFSSKISKEEGTATTIDAVIGKIGIVTEEIRPLDNPGIIKLSGEMWSAISSDSKKIETGLQVEVLQVKGVRLVVRKVGSEKG